MKSTQIIYIYTKRRARVDGITQFVELIPKLYSNLYNERDDKSKDKFIIGEKTRMGSNYDTFGGIIEYYLNQQNSIDDISNITDDDKKKIIELNIKQVKNLAIKKGNTKVKDAFIEHLHRGHDMQYGIYFSMTYATDDNDFKSQMIPTNTFTPDDRIIHYSTIDKLINYVIQTKTQENIALPLLYINSGWKYGVIQKDTIILENKDKFIQQIKDTYPPGNKRNPEIICQIPLPNSIFKFFYVSEMSGGEYKQKYQKYKQKYIKFKKDNGIK